MLASLYASLQCEREGCSSGSYFHFSTGSYQKLIYKEHVFFGQSDLLSSGDENDLVLVWLFTYSVANYRLLTSEITDL